MEEVTTIGLDLAKQVFQTHGAARSGAVVFRKPMRRIAGSGQGRSPGCTLQDI
jgi:hypothetical protein